MTNTPYYGYVKNPVLDSLELSTRADRVLRMYGRIETLDDFMALTKEQVMALKGAGMRTWGEIKTLQKNLRDGHPEVNAATATALRDSRAGHVEKVSLAGLFDDSEQALRDAAALAAFQAFTERMYVPLTDLGYVDETTLPSVAKAAARHAFAFADAFIAAREGKTDAEA